MSRRFSFLSFSLLIGLFALTGCDSSAITDGTTSAAQGPTSNAHIAAVYEARLRPLNPSFNGGAVTGLATFTIGTDGSFTAEVNARGLAVGTHVQHIHAGTACPTRADDANGDQVVDLLEGVPVYGGVLVSLDDDLADLSNGTFPMASGRKGLLDYEALSSVAAIEAALDGALDIGTRHVVLHGVAADTDLPETVQPSNPALLPVACGEIRRVQ